MTFQSDYAKGPTKVNSCWGGNGGGLWGWKKRNQALLGTFSLMMLSLILVLAENTGLGGFALLLSQEPQKPIDFRLGDAVKSHVLWGSSEESDVSAGERMLKAEPSIWKETSEVNISFASSHEGVQRLEGMATQEAESNEPTMTGDGRSPLRTANPRGRNKLSDMQPDPSAVPKQLQESPINRNALITRREPSETVELGDSSSKSVCDLTKGYWVKDEKRPFYSGKECKAYLASGFACRLMTRPDFEFEKLRWQPEGCDLPSFTGAGFLHRLRNKVVAFVGDSLGRQQFQSLMCMITEGKDDNRVEDAHRKWGKEAKWAYRFRETNTTILFHWSASLCEIEEGHPNEDPGFSAMHLDRPASFLKNNLHKIDVLVLNTGHHWNRGKLLSNKWHQYVDGEPLVDRKLAGMGHALNFTVHKVVQWLDEMLANGKQKPAVFFRTLSPRHFKNGDWNSGGTCDSTRSHYGPNSTEDKAAKPHLPVYTGPITERVAEIAVRGTSLNLLNITHLSQFREEGHISKYGIGKDSEHQDCLHWCLPGVPDVWNELLYANLVNDPSLSPTSDDQR